MLKNKRLKEAIENVGMVNNLDSQDFDKKSVGTAPVSYADAVLRARKRKEACKKAYEDQVKVAKEALKKEVSNEEHPEPLDKIRGNKERKMTLDEGLFESFEDEHLGKVELKEWMPSHAVWVKKEGKWKPYSALDFDTLSDEEVAAFKGLGYDDVKLLPNDGSEPDEVVESVVCPKCGKEPCECKVEESYLEEASNHIIPVKNKRKIIIVEDEASIECILDTFINTTSNTLGGGSTYYRVVFRVILDSIPPSFGISFFDEDRQKEFYESVPKKFDSVKQFIDYLVDVYNSYPTTSAPYNIGNIAKDLGYKDVVNIEESLFEDTEDITELVRKDMEAYKELKKYRKGSKAYKDAYAVWLDLHAQVTKKMFGGNVSFTVNEGLEESLSPMSEDYEEPRDYLVVVDEDGESSIEGADQYTIDGMCAELEDMSDEELAEREIAGWARLYLDDDGYIRISSSYAREDEFEELLKSTIRTYEHEINESSDGLDEDVKGSVYRVTYKHSPQVFSSVMVKAANEDEAKQKLAVKKPGKDIVGVSVMSDYEVKDMTNRGMSLMEAKVIDDFSSYEPWGEAVDTFDNIQNAGKMDALEHLIDDMYPDGINITELNDLLAFEDDWVYSMLDMPHDEDVVYDDVAVEIEDDEE